MLALPEEVRQARALRVNGLGLLRRGVGGLAGLAAVFAFTFRFSLASFATFTSFALSFALGSAQCIEHWCLLRLGGLFLTLT